MEKKKIVSIIGPSKSNCTPEIYEFGLKLGKAIIDLDFILVCGGMHGIMEAVCKGAKQSSNYKYGCTIGIIPTYNKNDANIFCDIVIPTGIGLSRNQIIANTGDILIAVSGGAGTLSEIAFGWQMNKKVICYTEFDGWAKNLAGKNLDAKHKGLLLSAKNLKQVVDYLKTV